MDAVLVLVVTVLVTDCAGTDTVLKRSCTETELPRVSLPLACPASHVIHVLQWLTALGARGDVSQCQFITDCTNAGDSDNNEFIPGCNGKTTCTEQVDLNGKNYCFNGTRLPYVQLEYECIPETWILNICDYASTSTSMLNASSLYVKTPAFPGNYGIVINQSCTCDVRGRNLTVKVLSLSLSDKSAMSIADDSAVVWRVATTTQQWNRDIAALQGPGTSLLNITFHDHGSRGEDAWLQISGNITILCGRNGNLGVTTVTPSTSTYSSSLSTSPSSSTPAPPTPRTSTSTSEVFPTTGAVIPWLTTRGGVSVSSSPSHHSSTAAVSPVSTRSTPSSVHPGNESCVDASCLVRATSSTSVATTDSSSVADDFILIKRSTLIIVISASVGVVVLLICIIVVFVVFRGRLCRRDPTYATTEAPVAEEPHTYTELRIYEDL